MAVPPMERKPAMLPCWRPSRHFFPNKMESRGKASGAGLGDGAKSPNQKRG